MDDEEQDLGAREIALQNGRVFVSAADTIIRVQQAAVGAIATGVSRDTGMSAAFGTTKSGRLFGLVIAMGDDGVEDMIDAMLAAGHHPPTVDYTDDQRFSGDEE